MAPCLVRLYTPQRWQFLLKYIEKRNAPPIVCATLQVATERKPIKNHHIKIILFLGLFSHIRPLRKREPSGSCRR